MSSTSARSSVRQRRRTAVAGFTGTTLEYYDFFIYGSTAALVFGKLFFPNYSPLAGTLASFATFAVGFLARPLGSVLFGHLGDRIGRRATLMYSLTLMGTSTVLIGFLPTFEQIGWFAPIALTVLRVLQGISIGGEWGGAALMLVEHAPENRRGFYGSIVYMGAPGGLLVATLAVDLSHSIAGDAFPAWGWRLPFLFSAVLFVISLLIRLALEETPVFTELERTDRTQRAPFRKLLATQWRDILLAAGVVVPGAVLFYIVTTYLLAYGTSEAVGMSRSELLTALLGASVIYLIAIPVFGLLSDIFSRKAVLIFGCLAAIPSSFGVFFAVDTGSTLATFVGMSVALAVVHASLVAPQAALIASRFDPRVRFSGVAFSQASSASIASGTAPMLATLFFAWTGASWLICLWMSVGAVVGILATIALCKRPPVVDADEGTEQGAALKGLAH